MKALVIASVLFFTLRAMSAEEVGESQKSTCAAIDGTDREAKIVDPLSTVPAEDQGAKGVSR